MSVRALHALSPSRWLPRVTWLSVGVVIGFFTGVALAGGEMEETYRDRVIRIDGNGTQCVVQSVTGGVPVRDDNPGDQ